MAMASECDGDRVVGISCVVGVGVAITGAARGIGRATAEALIAQGARIAIGDLDLDSPTLKKGP